MPQTITTSVQSLVEAAEKELENLSVEQAMTLHGRDAVRLRLWLFLWLCLRRLLSPSR